MGQKWFSTLDLASGYWHMEVDPKDRLKTAFICQSETASPTTETVTPIISASSHNFLSASGCVFLFHLFMVLFVRPVLKAQASLG